MVCHESYKRGAPCRFCGTQSQVFVNKGAISWDEAAKRRPSGQLFCPLESRACDLVPQKRHRARALYDLWHAIDGAFTGVLTRFRVSSYHVVTSTCRRWAWLGAFAVSVGKLRVRQRNKNALQGILARYLLIRFGPCGGRTLRRADPCQHRANENGPSYDGPFD